MDMVFPQQQRRRRHADAFIVIPDAKVQKTIVDKDFASFLALSTMTLSELKVWDEQISNSGSAPGQHCAIKAFARRLSADEPKEAVFIYDMFGLGALKPEDLLHQSVTQARRGPWLSCISRLRLDVFRWAVVMFGVAVDDIAAGDSEFFVSVACNNATDALIWLASRFKLDRDVICARGLWVFQYACSLDRMELVEWMAPYIRADKCAFLSPAEFKTIRCCLGEAVALDHEKVASYLTEWFDVKVPEMI
jgi:hypothetical protein